ncbi:MAG: hypothetical protein U1C74_07770 [Phenylobacterium sp.]|jgi:hypothetical protein|uniref:Uncharacterized protein n=1 Tax=Brevundimonas mediterranea TaxID=74329 RepID=A0AB37E4A0_9CAUL|nr:MULTISPECIES: hypothetical protein [Brevundimonas]MDZ4371300.1 hypothetical protein [Phenylobacterium sp.]QIH72063.1 hypothetical protein GYM46_03230 [Brevundimonas mediterranea]
MIGFGLVFERQGVAASSQNGKRNFAKGAELRGLAKVGTMNCKLANG